MTPSTISWPKVNLVFAILVKVEMSFKWLIALVFCSLHISIKPSPLLYYLICNIIFVKCINVISSSDLRKGKSWATFTHPVNVSEIKTIQISSNLGGISRILASVIITPFLWVEVNSGQVFVQHTAWTNYGSAKFSSRKLSAGKYSGSSNFCAIKSFQHGHGAKVQAVENLISLLNGMEGKA